VLLLELLHDLLEDLLPADVRLEEPPALLPTEELGAVLVRGVEVFGAAEALLDEVGEGPGLKSNDEDSGG
jgi:hypothetical protein